MNKQDKPTTKEYTMGFGKANLYAFLLIIPVYIVYLWLFTYVWGKETLEMGKEIVFNNFLPILIVGITVHELLHGITWGFFASKKMKSIKFGFKWKYLTPYCHCKEPLKVKHYKLGGAMPLVVLGIIPSVYGIVAGNGTFFFFGLLFTMAATGDILILIMLKKLNNNQYVSDHPDKMGFYIEE